MHWVETNQFYSQVEGHDTGIVSFSRLRKSLPRQVKYA